MGLIERYYYGDAGGSALRRHKELVQSWQRRTLGRRTDYYFWMLLALAIVAAFEFTPRHWRFLEGLLIGMLGTAFIMLPDLLVPDHIARLKRGGWGEQNTARALRPLRKHGWLVRHDLESASGKSNRDHIAVGPAVYLLDSKLLLDEVWLDGKGLHVRRVDETRDEYVISDLSQRMRSASRKLKWQIETAVGFPIAVYPVVVIWAHFDAKAQWDGDVAYVAGEELASWLVSRPTDLLDPRKRDSVREWLRTLPRASWSVDLTRRQRA